MLIETLDKLYQASYKFYLTRGEGKIDREVAHQRAVKILGWFAVYLPENYGRLLEYDDPVLEYIQDNEKYPRRVGLAAGLNKTGEFLEYSKNFGAAFDTVGAVTKDPNDGAPQPRIVADRNGLGLSNWMMLPNPGQEEVGKTIMKLSKGINRKRLKIFVNTAVSSKSIREGRVVEDFENVNMYFLRQDIDVVEANFGHLATAGYQSEVANKSVFSQVIRQAVEYNHFGMVRPKIFSVKLSMDTPDEVLKNRVRTAIYLGVDQINIGNTTRDPQILEKLDLYYPDQGGGYCGSLALPLVLPKIELVRELCASKNKTLVISAAVDDWQTAIRAHVAGADLIQSLHGFIMPKTGGLGFFYRMNRGVARFCREMGLNNVSELRGRDDMLVRLDNWGSRGEDLDNWN